MTPDIRLSIALVTRNRPDSLRRTLESLRAQDAQPFEIVVSDDSDEEFTARNRAIAGDAGCCYIAGPRRKLYANRNFVALQCTGTHIRTMDDDHTFPPGHFTKCLAAIHSDPHSIWTTGEVGFIEGIFQGKVATAGQLHPSGVSCPVSNPDDNWAIADGSTIYPREIFDSGMRMVEDFSYGSTYLEFGAYLYKQGWRSRCIPNAWIEHHLDPATPSRNDVCSRLYASLCFNLYFQPDPLRLCRYLLPLVLRTPSLLVKLPHLRSLACDRWAFPHE